MHESFEITESDFIFINLYILVNSNVSDLRSHFNLIDNFIHKDDLEK